MTINKLQDFYLNDKNIFKLMVRCTAMYIY